MISKYGLSVTIYILLLFDPYFKRYISDGLNFNSVVITNIKSYDCTKITFALLLRLIFNRM